MQFADEELRDVLGQIAVGGRRARSSPAFRAGKRRAPRTRAARGFGERQRGRPATRRNRRRRCAVPRDRTPASGPRRTASPTYAAAIGTRRVTSSNSSIVSAWASSRRATCDDAGDNRAECTSSASNRRSARAVPTTRSSRAQRVDSCTFFMASTHRAHREAGYHRTQPACFVVIVDSDIGLVRDLLADFSA